MNNGIFDFRKRIAAVAALVFVSHTLCGMPVSEGKAASVVQISDFQPTAADNDGGDDADENDGETETVTYTVTFTNCTLNEDEFKQLSDQLFSTEKTTVFSAGTNTGAISVSDDAVLQKNDIYVSGRLYRVDDEFSDIDNRKIVISRFVAVDSIPSFDELDFMGVVDGKYVRVGFDLTITPKNEYILRGEVEGMTFSVGDNFYIYRQNEDTEADTYEMNVAGNVLRVAPRTFTIERENTDISVFLNSVYVVPEERTFRWKDAASIIVIPSSSSAMEVSCDGNKYIFNVSNSRFRMSEVLEKEGVGYKQNAKIGLRAVPNTINAVLNYEGDEERSGANQLLKVQNLDDELFYRVPYLENGGYYLYSYDYRGEVTVPQSQLYSDVSTNERFFNIPAQPGEAEITLNYKKLPTFGSYTYKPADGISKRNQNCYTIDGRNSNTALMTFTSEQFGSAFVYDSFSGENASGFSSSGFIINSRKNAYTVTRSQIENSHFFFAKDVLKSGEKNATGLGSDICFYVDRNAPVSSVKDTETGGAPDSGKWSGKSGLTVALDIDDTEACPLSGNSSSYEERTVRDVYDRYINAVSDDGSEIRSVVIGDHRFDRPANGWTDTANIVSYIENDAVRAGEQKAVEYLMSNSLADADTVHIARDREYFYYKTLLRNGICERIETELSNELDEAEHLIKAYVENEEDVPAEVISQSQKADERLTAFRAAVSDYRKALAAAKTAYKAVPSLSYDTENKRFVISLKANAASANSIFTETIPVFAVDNSNNSGIGEKSDEIVFNYDGAAPVITDNDIRIENAVLIGEKNGVKQYVLRDGTELSAKVDDVLRSGSSEKQGTGVDSVVWELDGVRHRMNGYGDSYSARLNAEDVGGNDVNSEITFYAVDRVGNETKLSSGSAKDKFRVIIDNTAPSCKITDISDPSVAYADEEHNKKWFSSYSGIKMQVSADDSDPAKSSGIEKLVININGRDNEVNIASSGIDPTALSKGGYYITFEADQAPDSFKASLRSSADQGFEVSLGGNYYRIGRSFDGSYEDIPDKGAVSVKVSAVDFAGHSTDSGCEKAFLDLEKPSVSRIEYGGRNIINRDGVVKYSVFAGSEAEFTVKAGDNLPVSGIESMNVSLVNADGTPYKGEIEVRNTVPDKEWRFTIPAGFRGKVSAYVESNVHRRSDTVNTYGIITESAQIHEQNSSAAVELPAAQHHDAQGLPLYSGDVDVKLSVRDGFSGISQVYLTSSGAGGGNAYVSDDGNIENAETGSWSVAGKYENLVTAMNGSIRISDNVNGSSVSLGYLDNAGYYEEAAASESFSIDKTDPRVEVSFTDQNSGGDQEFRDVYKNSRRAVITITERNFDPNLVEVTVNGARQRVDFPLTGGTSGTDTAQYRGEVPFDDDGTYTLSVKCTDMAGRSAGDYTSDSFTIDKTAPALNVGFDKTLENDHFYHDNMTMTFKVSDENFEPSRINISGTYNGSAESFPKPSDWSRVGKDYFSTIKFGRDGEYSVSVSGSDKAGNALDPYNTKFCIDTTAPSISIGEVEKANGGAEIRPHILFNDTNLDRDSISITLEGAKRGKDLPFDGQFNETPEGLDYVFDNFPARKAYDDIYTIKASVKDSADNQLDKELRFSVNRFGSTFEFDKDSRMLADKYISKAQDIVLMEYNVDKHAEKCGVFITRDSEMIELTEGRDYSVEHSGGSGEWSEYKYIIYASNFDTDAKYTVSVHTVDEAGNINISDSDKKKAELSFFVDKTKPLCIPLNISENSAYKGESYTAHLSVTDNIDLKNVEVYINGDKTGTRLDNDECTFDIPNSSRSQDIRVILTDMADNEIEYNYRNVLVTTNVARLLIRKTWVKVTGISAIALAGAGAFLLRRRRKNKLL